MSGPLNLRPLVEDDRWRLRDWRNSERIRTVSIDDALIPPDRHAAWFDRTIGDRAEQFRVVEWELRPVGLVQLEGLDRAQHISSWGCYLGETDVPPGVGASLPLLALGYGFGPRGLRRMTAGVLSINPNMLAIHRRLTIPVEGLLRRHVRRSDGREVDLHLYGVHRDEWPELRETGLRLFPSHVRPAVEAWTS